MNFNRGLLTAAFLFAGTTGALAALKWDSQTAELKVQRGVDTDGRVHFDCVNTGSKPVTITGITTACGCTTATPEVETIPPGQRDRIWVIFSLGQRHGNLVKDITLHTDDPDVPDSVLKLKVTIVEAIGAPAKPVSN